MEFAGVPVNEKFIADSVALVSGDVENAIKKDLAGVKYIHIKADSCTRRRRSVINLNAQYVRDWKLHTANLGTVEVTES